MKKYVAIAISLALVTGLNIYFRSFPINFPQLKTRAKEVVDQVVRQNAMQEIYKKFPQFNPLAKDKIVTNKIAEYKKADKEQIKQQIDEGYRQLKSRFQDDSGQTYMMELDCWHWARYVENVIKLGHPGDEVVYGNQWDLYMLAPLGSYLHWEQSLYYFSAWLYKFFSLFKKVPLFTFLFYLPLFFSTILVVSLYFFSFRYGSHIGAVTSCLFVGLTPILLQRSCAGWFDRDILNLIFPLLVIWTYILAFDASKFKLRMFWICFSAFWVGLFCFTYTHWWFIFLILIIYEGFSLVYLIFLRLYFKNKNLALVKQHILSLFFFLVFSFLWIVILAGKAPVIAFYKQVTQAITLNKPLMTSIWPNVYSTVGELRTMDIKEIANSVGGMLFFVSSAIAMVILLVSAFWNKDYAGFKRETIIILVIWFLAMIFASSRGIRFVMFLPVPLGISLGWVMNNIYVYFKNRAHLGGMILVVAVFLFSCGLSIKKGYSAATNLYPLMDDTWYSVLNLIKEKTTPETIVNSWWDFGDWFKVAARRRVIFDGQSQDTPQAYWMAKAMLTGNEEESIAILRMLNNGGNKAFEIINEHIKNELQSVLLLESVLVSKPEEAEKRLLDFIPLPAAQEVMKLIYYAPSRACFVVDNTMLPKMGAISYLGNWDFSKVYIAQNFDKTEKNQIIDYLKKLGRDSQDMQRFYQEVFLISPKKLDDWLSRRVLFYSELVKGREKGDEVYFDNGFIYNTKEQIIRSSSGQIPRSLIFTTEEGISEVFNNNANVGYSVFVMRDKDAYRCILLDRELANSIFTRLYFFRGRGLRHFTPLIDAEEGDSYIRVFYINW